jgi:hypothetical protein
MSQAPLVFMWRDVLRFSKVRGTRVLRGAQVAGLDDNPM